MVKVILDAEVFSGVLVNENHAIIINGKTLLFLKVIQVKGEKDTYEYLENYSIFDEELEVDNVEKHLIKVKKYLNEKTLIEYFSTIYPNGSDYNFGIRP
ncbi:hypothetical protein ACQCT3_17845 [Sutcliffiella horikoshii]|uniref:hypothetical protein n=1 Tax=Sutcliffiella horikoshii TaxID=79883 RepID=UPI003CF4F60F